jgi:adenosine 3'-phospho 5'-phosphosulfate transporter B2
LDIFVYGTRKDQDLTTLSESKGDSTRSIHEFAGSAIKEENIPTRKRLLLFLFCFAGLQISYLLWGLMQERIIKFDYSTNSEIGPDSLNNNAKLSKFKNSQFLVLANRFAALILSSLILIVCNRKKVELFCMSLELPRTKSFRKVVSHENWGPLFVCSYSSLSNVLSSWFQYESLKYVSFTTQLLAKSSKSVFVMITGRVISQKKYSKKEYFFVSLIAIGIFLFSDVNIKSMEKTNKMIETTLPGILCLLFYLITDSFTSTWQDDLIKTYSMSSISLMFITNLYSCVFTFVSLWSNSELGESVKFLSEHSGITHHIGLLSLTSAIGQIFIFVTIQNFGALVFSLIMTTRQVLSIVLSSIVFNHHFKAFSAYSSYLSHSFFNNVSNWIFSRRF